MKRGNNLLKFMINAAVFIILEFAALHLLSNNKSMQSFFISKKAHAFMANFWGLTQNISYYFSLREVNDSLAKDNFILTQRLQELANTKQLTHLPQSTLIQYYKSKYNNFSTLPAEISKISLNKEHNYIIINKGLKDGVELESAVLSSNGVIGIIEAVGEHYSYASSFMNKNISISSRLNKTGAVGILYWDGKSTNKAILKDIPLQYQIEKGDTVYTSGYSSIFPKDIALGTCYDYNIINGSTYEVNIKLFIDFSSIRYVYIAKNNRKKEIEDLENLYK